MYHSIRFRLKAISYTPAPQSEALHVQDKRGQVGGKRKVKRRGRSSDIALLWVLQYWILVFISFDIYSHEYTRNRPAAMVFPIVF